jgi:hypothetical protein
MTKNLPSKRPIKPGSIAVLREIHSRKKNDTKKELIEAVSRMQTGTTKNVPSDFKWTKRALATEAGIHVNTLIAKNQEGRHVYQEVLDLFIRHRAPGRERKQDLGQALIIKLRGELAESNRERDMLIERLKDSEIRIVEERDRRTWAIRDLEYANKRLADAGLTLQQ